MKTIIYTLLMVIIFASCEKEEAIELKSTSIDEFNVDSIKKIEWRRYDAIQLVTISFINDTVLLFKRNNYTNLSKSNYDNYATKQYVTYKFKEDSLIMNWNLVTNYYSEIPYSLDKNKDMFERYKYEASKDSMQFYYKGSLSTANKYYSKKQRGAY